MPGKNEVINAAVSRLKKSPMFNFSLSSKELFHSDFLDWLCKSYPAEVMPIFARRMVNHPLSVNWKVEREKGHQDLKFSFEDGSVLIVENKVKSIPNKEQLQRYCHKFSGKPLHSFLLLSLVKPEFVASTDDDTIQLGDDCRWAFLAYQDLAQELKSILPIVEKRDLYHGKLLYDYIEFIVFLSEIANESALSPESSEDFFTFYQFMPVLRNLRIHDLVYKYIYSDMARFVTTRLQNFGYKVQGEGRPEKGKKGQVFVDSNFTNGTGMFTVYYVVIGDKEVGGPCVLFIQLQDNMFRQFLYVKGNKRSLQIAEVLADKNLWFNFDRLPESSVIKRKRKEKQFNRFTGSNLYRYKLIDKISPDKLAEVIIEYIDQVKKNVRIIRGIVKKASK